MAAITNKRRGRPAIKPYIHEMIRREILLEQGQPPERRLPVNVLADQIQRRLIEKNEKRVPRLSTLEKYISFYRSTTSLDEPWSLGESTKLEYDIPGDATGILLELWKYSLEIGYPFTLRHARWIARLHKVIVTGTNDIDHWKQIQILFFTTLRYADRERVSQALKQAQFDTTAEDADLVIPLTEAMILNEFDVLPLACLSEIRGKVNEKFEKEKGKKREIRIGPENSYDILRTEPNVAVVLHILRRPRSIDRYGLLNDNKVWYKFLSRCTEIQDVIGNLAVDQQRAYAILVTCFSKGPKWDDLPVQDYLDIIGKFAELVSRCSTLDEILGSVIYDEREKGIFDSFVEKVGLTSPDDISLLDRMVGVSAVRKVASLKEAKE